MDNERILVIDDDENIVRILTLYLRSKGYDVVSCKSGSRALSVFTDTKPDLVLLDVMLPGMDGREILSKIRKLSRTPVIMLTAKGETDDRIHALDGGADDYIVKPFDSKELFARIRAVLRRSSSSGNKTGSRRVEFANISVDFDNYTVMKNGEKVRMSPKELELLYYLASNLGRAITRSELLRAVWGEDYFGDGRTLDVHIKRIRSHLGTDNPWKITTICSVGYKLELTDNE